MRFLKTLFILIFIPGSVLAQVFELPKTPVLIEANTKHFEIFEASSFLSKLDCPPKLTNANFAQFNFLDSLPLPELIEKQLFSDIIPFNCTQLYQFALTHNHYLPVFQSALKNAGVNEKYALLPLILSGSNPSLKFDKDKSGAWQLSYVTARKYGLGITPFIDERNDINKSSHAAARYIQFLNQYYLNNELLVVTAFYTSIPFVNNQINQLETVNPVSFYYALPADVQSYFSYLKAWTNWYQNLELHSVKLKFNEQEKWLPLQATDTIEFSTISKFMDISEQEIALINPVLIGQTMLPNSKYPLLLPVKKAEQFEEKHTEFIAFQKAEKERKEKELAALKEKMEKGIPDLTTHTAITYRVKSGDVLGKIASRNHVKVSQIKQWNNLRSDRINIGQKLILYVPNSKASGLKADTQEAKPKPKNTAAVPGKGTPTIYTVKAGESLWLIAKKFPGVSAENIMEWNGISDKIDLGQKLKIYSPE